VLTTTPATPAPNAPEISCTVLIAAAAATPSAGSSTESIARTDKWGQAIPIPIPATSSANVHAATVPADALSRWVSAPSARPDATTIGAATITRPIARGLSSDALTISETVQPTASAAPRNPAASGVMCANRWPNSGT
jgi:hypothetical protein